MTLRHYTQKRYAINAAAERTRADLRREADGCELCNHSPYRQWPELPVHMSVLCCHEILNGPLRAACLGKRHSLLVVCWKCNLERLTNKREWPEARQLAVVFVRRPADYDLAAHNELANPRAPLRILQSEVDRYVPGIMELTEPTS